MDILFSKMTSDDAKEVFEIENNLLGMCSLESILKTINSDTLNYYVLKIDGTLVGFIEFSIVSDECELYDIAIKVNFQGKGYSKILMDNMLKIAGENNCATIFLEVNSINYRAIKLYEKYGFKNYLVRKNYYGDNDAILMKLEL